MSFSTAPWLLKADAPSIFEGYTTWRETKIAYMSKGLVKNTSTAGLLPIIFPSGHCICCKAADNNIYYFPIATKGTASATNFNSNTLGHATSVMLDKTYVLCSSGIAFYVTLDWGIESYGPWKTEMEAHSTLGIGGSVGFSKDIQIRALYNFSNSSGKTITIPNEITVPSGTTGNEYSIHKYSATSSGWKIDSINVSYQIDGESEYSSIFDFSSPSGRIVSTSATYFGINLRAIA